MRDLLSPGVSEVVHLYRSIASTSPFSLSASMLVDTLRENSMDGHREKEVKEVHSLEALARAMTSRSASLYGYRSVYSSRLTDALAWLIVRFEGPHVELARDERNEGRIRTFILLAKLVARRAVRNVLGKKFTPLEFLVFVNCLMELRDAAEQSVQEGVFERNQFYGRIVELSQSHSLDADATHHRQSTDTC